jgi:hypothetical protein
MVGGSLWRVLARCPGFLTGYWLWRARLTARGQVRWRRSGLVLRVIAVRTRGRPSAQSSGGKIRRTGDGAADDAQGADEADAVGVDVGGFGGSADEDGDGVVDDQPGPDFLVDEVG